MTKLACLISTVALLPLGTALYAQYGSSGQPPDQSEHQAQQTKENKKAGKKNTLVGCLMQGTAENSFLLKRKGTGHEILLEGSDDLAQHVNQMVQIKGTMSQESGKDVFKVDQLKKVGNSSSCGENKGSEAGEKPSPTPR